MLFLLHVQTLGQHSCCPSTDLPKSLHSPFFTGPNPTERIQKRHWNCGISQVNISKTSPNLNLPSSKNSQQIGKIHRPCQVRAVPWSLAQDFPLQAGEVSGADTSYPHPRQGLVTVPFWEYWTSPYSSHGIDQIPNGWVMFNGDISHDPWLIPSSKWHQTSSNRIWSMRISESQLEPTTPPGTTQRSLRAGNPSGKNMKNQLFSQGAPVR